MSNFYGQNVTAVDICNTLFDSNTTYDFIKFCIKSGKLSGRHRVLNSLLLSKASPVFYGLAVLQRVIKQDLFKILTVRYLKGRTVAQVHQWAEEFYTAVLEPRTIDSAMHIFRRFRKEEILLVSSTLYPIASVIAEKLGVLGFLATELEVEGERYTGKIAKELSGRKLAAIKQSFQNEVRISAVMTDNFTDLELMNASEECYAICYNARQEKFWSVIPHVSIIKIPVSLQNPS